MSDSQPESPTINFFSEDIVFSITNPEKITSWLQFVVKDNNRLLGSLNYIFCSDDFLLKLNLQYLEHNTLTDVITFPFSDHPIEADIYISIERVRDNAAKYCVNEFQELRRVIVHGLLHLLGFADKTDGDILLMRSKENLYLDKFLDF